MPAPAPTYAPQRYIGALRPHRGSAPDPPASCVRGLGVRPRDITRFWYQQPEQEVHEDPRESCRDDRAHHVDDLQQGGIDAKVFGQASYDSGDLSLALERRKGRETSGISPPRSLRWCWPACLTRCSSATGPQVRARTDLWSTARSRRCRPKGSRRPPGLSAACAG
jgi:hypothetical protein